MEYRQAATDVLGAIGGAANLETAMTCLTRLRLTLKNPALANGEALRAIPGVLGIATRGGDTVEVVFGPSAIEGVSQEFSRAAGLEVGAVGGQTASLAQLDAPTGADPAPADATAARPASHVVITPGRRSSYRAQQHAAIAEERLEREDLETLRAFLKEAGEPEAAGRQPAGEGRAVLVINGPNINLLGVREPELYGKSDYTTLVRICKAAAAEAGFARVKCYQSNHEGSLVDEIQAALGSFDGIVINPAAYTHTSVAILDAIKAVALPCVEVHISNVEKREDFRQVSYVRQACFETITGMGLAGYRKAILDLAAHLKM